MHAESSRFVFIVTLSMIFFTIPLLASYVQAAKVHLEWDATTHNTDGTPITDLAGYTIYYWQADWNFPQSIAVDSQTTHTVIDLEVDKTYQFTVTALNTSGAESVFTSEVITITTVPVDTDGNGLTDEEAQIIYSTNPTLADANGDDLQNLLVDDTDNDGFSDEQEFISDSDPTDPISTPPSVTLWLEAETGQLLSPMEVGTDPAATAGQYVWVPVGPAQVLDSKPEGGAVHYRFSVPTASIYVIWGRVITNSTTEDAFYITLNDNASLPWKARSSGPETWGWDVIGESHHLTSQDFSTPFLFALEAGEHVLVVHQGEVGIKLDQLLITNDFTLIPSDTGQTQ